MIAHKVLRFMRIDQSDRYCMALKLDMNKAYDKVEWKFLMKILGKMRFNSKWIGWIMKCVVSVSYKILIN